MGKIKKQYSVHQVKNFIIVECEDENSSFTLGVSMLLKIQRDANMTLAENNDKKPINKKLIELLKDSK